MEKSFAFTNLTPRKKSSPFVANIKQVQVFKKFTNMGSCFVSAPVYYRSKNVSAALR